MRAKRSVVWAATALARLLLGAVVLAAQACVPVIEFAFGPH